MVMSTTWQLPKYQFREQDEGLEFTRKGKTRIVRYKDISRIRLIRFENGYACHLTAGGHTYTFNLSTKTVQTQTAHIVGFCKLLELVHRETAHMQSVEYVQGSTLFAKAMYVMASLLVLTVLFLLLFGKEGRMLRNPLPVLVLSGTAVGCFGLARSFKLKHYAPDDIPVYLVPRMA
jgi:hypothetical protein